MEKNYAPRTINKHISAIRSALSYAVRAELIPENKLLGPHRLFLREEVKPLRIVTVEEVKALMRKARDIRYKSAISLAYYHGLRRGEICNLMWKDIDFENHKLNVVDRPDAHVKTRRSRTVFMREETAQLLAQLCVQQSNEYVFEKPHKFYNSVDKWFDRIVTRAGISRCTLHDLRKTCNTLMKEAGVPAEVAMQILGHSSIEVNQRHYTGILTEQQKTAINLIPSIE